MDEVFASAGIDSSSFTGAGAAGVTKDGKMYGMPMMPSSPEDLLEHARKFKAATGKPYMIQQLANGVSPYTRLFYTFMAQQNSDFFADPMNVKLQSDEARNVVNLFKTIFDEDLTTKDMDYPSAVAAFPGGEGGIALNGTWLIGDYVAASEKKGALEGGYTVYPYPQLFEADASYADGHAWVMPAKERSEDNLVATAKFLRFLTDNDHQWARTGHLPGVQAVFDMEEFKNLPHRANIAKIAQTGVSLPSAVLRQFAVKDIIGEGIAAAITGHKSVDDALTDAEYRVNDLLNNL